MDNIRKPSVCFIFRRKDSYFFSIERVFSSLIQALHPYIEASKENVPRHSSSLNDIVANIIAARGYQADVYHVTGDIHYAVLGLPGRKTVLTIHDCVFLERNSGLKKRIFKWIWLKGPVRRAAIVTTISEKSRLDIIRYSGCRPEKIVVIPNPVNDLIVYTEKGFDPHRPVVLFIGFTPNKNLLRVIPAMEGIAAQLHIVGKIPDEAMDLLERHRIDYRQSIGLDDRELAACYADADLVLFPSTYEGFGLPILEAHKAGRPVITSDLSPMKEVAGSAACLVDPFSISSIREGILRVIEDASYRGGLVKKGLENVRRYEVSAIADQYLACYNRLIPTSKCAE